MSRSMDNMDVSDGCTARTFRVASRTRLSHSPPRGTRYPAHQGPVARDSVARATPCTRQAPEKAVPYLVTSAGGPSLHQACHVGARPLFRCLGCDTALLVTQRTRHRTYVPA